VSFTLITEKHIHLCCQQRSKISALDRREP
jgi:hypothetical protein